MSIPLDSDLMRSFLAVADTGSVTLAAARVGRTQSAVSMQVKRLEESLGQPLFDRQPRGMVLTLRGEQLAPYARRVVALLEEAAVALRIKQLSGPVRVGIPHEYTGSVLPRALAAFAERHPEAEVYIRCNHSEPLAESLARDELDLIVVYDWHYVDEGELLCIDPTVWVTSRSHGQHRQKPLPVAIYYNSPWCRDFAERSLDQQGLRWRVAFECDDPGPMRSAVANGLAIAPMSRSTIPQGCRELTAAEGFPIVDSAHVLLRRNPQGSTPAIDAMAEMLHDAFRPLVEMA